MEDIISLMAQTANKIKTPEHYVGDLIHDGAFVIQTAEVGAEFFWVFKGNECGTWMFKGEDNYKKYGQIGGIREAFKLTVTAVNEFGKFKGTIEKLVEEPVKQEQQSNG